MMDIYNKYVISKAKSMEYFSGNDKTFNLGEWRAWRVACFDVGKVLDPNEFKKKNNDNCG